MESPRLRELDPAARGSQDAGSRNLVLTWGLYKDRTAWNGINLYAATAYRILPFPEMRLANVLHTYRGL